jgi:hypothetical protein
MDFSDNFHNIKNFVQVDHFKKNYKNLVISSFDRSRKTAVGRKIFPIGKNERELVPEYRVKISGNPDHHALQNLSSNPTATFSEFYNNANYLAICKSMELGKISP